MKRSSGASRIVSSRICVPSTIDLSTCDSAAALTITCTQDTTS